MSPAASVLGLGVVGPFGTGAEALLMALKNGPPAPVAASHPDGFETLSLTAPLELLNSRFDRNAIRRLDRYSRLALLGASLAFEDAGLAPGGAGMALVIASGQGSANSSYAFVESMIEGRDALNSPSHFSNSVHNAAAAAVSSVFGLTGPCLTVSLGRDSLATGLSAAINYLERGYAELVLFGAVDEYAPPYARGSDEALGPMVHGEGAVFFILSSKIAGKPVISLEDTLKTCGAGAERFAGHLPGGPFFGLALAALNSRTIK